MNYQESMTILNACTKTSGNLLKAPRIFLLFLLYFVVPKYLGFNKFFWRRRRQTETHKNGDIARHPERNVKSTRTVSKDTSVVDSDDSTIQLPTGNHTKKKEFEYKFCG